MEMQTEKRQKFGFFKQLVTAVFIPGRYVRFFQLKMWRTVGFVFLYMLLSICVSLYLPFALQQIFGESYREIIDQYVPEFTLEDGVLLLEEPVRYDSGLTVVVADSNIETFTTDALSDYQEYRAVYLIGQNNMVIREGTQTSEYAFADLALESLNKAGLYGYLPSFYLIIAISGLTAYFSSMSDYLVWACVFTLVGKVLQSIIFRKGETLNFFRLFQLGVFARAPYALVSTLFALFGYAVPYGMALGVAMTFTYLFFAMRFLFQDGYEEPAATPKSSVSASSSSKERNGEGKTVTPLMAYRNYYSNPDADEEDEAEDSDDVEADEKSEGSEEIDKSEETN